MVLPSMVTRLNLFFAFSVLVTSCNSWTETDVRELERLTRRLQDSPNPSDLRRLFSGMRSKDSLEAVNYIHFSADLIEIKVVRDELEAVVRSRIVGSDPWVARACAEQLPVLVRQEPMGFDGEIRRCLQSYNSDISWFALKAISTLGDQGDRFVPDIEQYLMNVLHAENPTGRDAGVDALKSIGTERALSVLSNLENSGNQ